MKAETGKSYPLIALIGLAILSTNNSVFDFSCPHPHEQHSSAGFNSSTGKSAQAGSTGTSINPSAPLSIAL